MPLPFLLHPDLETMDERTVLLPGQRVKFKGKWATVLGTECPECGHVGAPHPPMVETSDGCRLCLCCGPVD